ncbi:unnamed protein product [Rhizoctonia solani]|uniref:Minor extracellular protease vpr n=1 Tax=Rhizoctonia solani TaxID=456999 RepID=A0A8H3GCV0_9AGAM|nr:unnamed protein product [Rhizoctonia solani]
MEPNSYIVELDPGEHLKRGFASPHEELYHDLRRRGVSWDVTKEYFSPLLTGTAVKLHHDIDLVKLVEAKGVRSVTPVYFHAAPEPISQQVTGNSNMTHTGDSLPAHVMTGVDKLHQEGHFGKGIKIGIIDTGVDYTHPALGGSFGPGNKVIGGYDFVGDNYTGRLGPPPAPDNDSLDNCNGHGTHVAGIIGANPNNPWNMSGVAYESEIHAYRVFGCRGGASDAIIIDAMLRAYDDGNDVINMSPGSPNGWSGGLPAVVASRIADNGRGFVVSVGNSGAYGSWYTATPATGRNVISVGSVDNAILNIQNEIVSNGRKIPYLSLNSIPIPSGLPIYATSQDPTVVDDACHPLPSNTPDLSSRLVLIRRGTCSFINKTDNAAAFGAQYFLIYDNVDGPIGAITTNYTSALISEPDGRFLLEEAIPNEDTVSFPNSPATIPNPTGGLMSSFSTYGPTFDMYLKPALVTPGGEIVSTMPVALGSWAIKSGTSMAAPYAAGSGALVLGAKGKNAEVAKAVRSIFENNAIPVKAAHMNSSLVETASWQGAGLINVYNAVKSTGSLFPAELLLNDTAHFNGTQTLTVKNGGKESVIYTFAHVSAGTSNTIEGIEVIPGPVPLTAAPATVDIIPSNIVIPAGESAQVQVIIDDTNAYFGVNLPLITDKDGDPIPSNRTVVYSMNGTDTPTVIYRLVMGTPLLRMDLIDSNANGTRTSRRSDDEIEFAQHANQLTNPSISRRSVMDWVSSKVCQNCGGVETLGLLLEREYVARNTIAPTAQAGGYSTVNIRQFANGTAIPNGSYRIMVRALKITGNPQFEGDYEMWTSPELQVKRP